MRSSSVMTDFDKVLTNRLSLMRVASRHLVDLRRLYSDPRTMAMLGGARTVAQTQSTLKSLVRHWNDNHFGPWVARESASGFFVGMGGLRQVVVDDVKEVEIGYALLPGFWGRGFATELANAAVHVAFDMLSLPHLVSFTLPTNAGSRRVMEKVGFSFERDFTYNGHPQVLYRLTAADWKSSVGSRTRDLRPLPDRADSHDGWH